MFGHVKSHPTFHRLVEVLMEEAKRTQRLSARADDGLENEGPRIQEQDRQVNKMIKLIN